MVDDRPRQGGLANLLSIPEAIQKGPAAPRLGSRERQASADWSCCKHSANFTSGRSKSPTTWAAWFRPTAERAIARASSSSCNRSSRCQQATSSPTCVAAQRRPAATSLERLAAKASTACRLHAAGSPSLGGALADLESGSIKKAATSHSSRPPRALAEVLAGLKSHDWAAKVGLTSIAIIILWQSLSPQAAANHSRSAAGGGVCHRLGVGRIAAGAVRRSARPPDRRIDACPLSTC